MLTMPVHVCAVSRSLWNAIMSWHGNWIVKRTSPPIRPLSVSASGTRAPGFCSFQRTKRSCVLLTRHFASVFVAACFGRGLREHA